MKEFRDRVLLPLAVPLLAAGVIVVVVLNFSRVLLALEETVSASLATVVAIAIASSILFGSAYFSARGEARSAGNVAVLASAGMALVFAGFVGFAAIEEEAREAAAEKNGGKPEGPPDVTVTAFDLGFKEKQLQAAAGSVRVGYVNDGQILHTLLFDGVGGFKLEVPSKGAKDAGEVDLEPGTYTYFCDVPGHRPAGMEGTLTVSEGGGGQAAAGGGGGGGAEITAGDLYLKPKELSAPSGPVEITYRNEGKLLHTLLVEEVPKFKKLEVASTGDTDSGTLEIGPGTYTLYCDQPGHRAAGMEAKLKVG